MIMCVVCSVTHTDVTNGITIKQTAHTYNAGNAFWALYYDTADSWWANYKNSSRSCMDMRAGAKRAMAVVKNMTVTVQPHDYVRPHIWYVVLLNCPMADEPSGLLDIDYTLHFVNEGQSEVGFDEEGLLALNIFYFIAFLLVCVVHGAAVLFLYRKGIAHPIVLLLGLVLVLIVFSLFFVMIHWGTYSSNGIGANGCRAFGQFLMGTANVIFAMLLVAIASGWAITYHELPRKWTIVGMTGAYFLCFFILFIIMTATGQTAASTQFVYARGALLVFVVFYILLCWIGVWGYFAYSLFRTWREEAQYDKRLFYLVFGIGYSAWFVLPALLNFISMAIDEWYRPRVVDAFQLTSTFIGVVALVVLLWPSRMEKYFRISTHSDTDFPAPVSGATDGV